MSNTLFRWFAGTVAGLGLAACAASDSQAPDCPVPDFSEGDFPGALAHVRYLADDALEGRAVATRGERCAGEYIATVFQSLGLDPAGSDGTYFQPFQVRTGSRLTAPGSLAISQDQGGEGNPFTPAEGQWRPFGFSGSGTVEGTLVYAPEGVAGAGGEPVEVPALDGRIVVMEASREGIPAGAMAAEPHYMATVSQGRGAAALLILLDEGATLPDPATEEKPFVRIPVVALTGEAASAVREAARSGSATGSLSVQVEPASSEARNVVALLPGSDPARSAEVVVLGAHYDHLGYGGGSSLAPGAREIHNGADDNASGTAALLEVARILSEGPRPARPVLFVAFSGEERGLLGSAHYVADPTVPLDGAVAMINMDMVGRVRDNTATVFGLSTAEEWEPLLNGINQRQPEPFTLTFLPDGYGPSDHSSFYGAGMPVLHFFTNTHSEYHRPEDDWDTIDGPGLDRLAALVGDLTGELAGPADEDPVALTVVQAEPPAPAQEGARGYGPYFGSIPDMGFQGYGVRLSGAREGSPAANAGLRSGDVIVAFGGTEVGDLYQYTYALREMKPGDVVEVVVERDGVRITVQAVLGERR